MQGIRQVVLTVWALGGISGIAAANATDQWPQWRGPDGTGSSAGSPPLHWDDDRNVLWKTPIEGEGTSSPIVWGDQVFLLTAVATDETVEREQPEPDDRGRQRTLPTKIHEFVVLSVDREDGSILWEEVARRELPHEGIHSTGSFAAASVVTDGELLLANFGSRGLYAYDLEGTKLWEVDFGDMRTRNSFGEGSSAVLHGDTVAVVWDHEDDSFVVALERDTGKEKWRKAREEATTWATPLVVEVEGKAQVIVNGSTVRSYDLATGKELWHAEGMTGNAIPTPIHVDGTVYVTTGFRGDAMKAIDLNKASGNVEESGALVWAFDEDSPYVPTPAYHNGVLYFLKRMSGILTAVDVETGKRISGPTRLELGNIYASPVAAADRLYVTDLEGRTLVLDVEDPSEVLATNTISDGCRGSLAVVGDRIYYRGAEFLYCLADQE